jgi:ABC-type antimicrobial peptide transport system ATPase subunit
MLSENSNFGAHTTLNPIGTSLDTMHMQTRRGQLRGLGGDSGIGPATVAKGFSGLSGFGDFLTEAKNFIISPLGVLILAGSIMFLGQRFNWWGEGEF